jgi:hypothetical protein
MSDTALVRLPSAAHSRNMFRRAAWLAIFAFLSGCGSSDDSAEYAGPFGRGLVWGGQTGSLTPVCGLREQLSLPDNARGFVVDTKGCRSASPLGEVALTDADGELVEFEWRPLGDGKYLAVPTQALEEGSYTVTAADEAVPVTVVEAAAPPARVGELELISSPACGVTLELRLDPALVPYAPLLQLSVSTDGNSVIWKDYGELSADEGSLLLECDGGGCWLGRGSHRITVSATIAGEAVVLENAFIQVNVNCSGDGSDDGPGPACSTPRPAKSGFSALVVGMAIALLGSLRRRATRRDR